MSDTQRHRHARPMRRLLVTAMGVIAVVGWVVPTSSQAVRPQAGEASSRPPAPADATSRLGGPAGIVKTSDGNPVGGLMVQLIAQKTSIRTTVYTNEQGRYAFPKLERGDYTLRIPRPLEFRRYKRASVHIDGPTALPEIVVERVTNGEFLPPNPDILPQLTGAEWVAITPGTIQEKEAFVNTCTTGCHGGDNPFRVRFDEPSWRKLVHRMYNYNLRTLVRPSGGRGGPTEKLIADWLVRNRGLETPMPPIKPFPRPHGPATRAIVTEYEIPWALANVHDVDGDAQGNIWFTVNRSPFIGKLDPTTGKVTSYRVPKPPAMVTARVAYKYTDPPGTHPGLHWLAVDRNTGLVWFSDTWAHALGRLDPRTGEVQQVNAGTPANHGLSPDGLSIWKTDGGKLLQFDTRTVLQTGKPVKEYQLKDADSTYGNFLSQDGRYFGGGSNHVVWLDIRTGELREIPLSVGGRGRGGFDPEGNIWVGGRKLTKYEPKTRVLAQYSPPTPYIHFYSARSDKNGDIWAGEQHGGRIARFNPRTHQWIEYVMPSPWAFDVNSWIDNSTSPPTFWYGDQFGYIVRIQPLE
jgi:streptogramin lyase